jgi:hypothetical protein
MQYTTLTGALAVMVALLACKKKEEPAVIDAWPPPAIEVPADKPAEPTPAEPAAPESTGTAPSGPTGPKPTTTVTPKDAGAKDAATAAKTDAAAPAPAPGPSKECTDRCNSALRTCLTPSVTEGGLPSLGDPTACQKAFNDCTAACK